MNSASLFSKRISSTSKPSTLKCVFKGTINHSLLKELLFLREYLYEMTKNQRLYKPFFNLAIREGPKP